MRTPQIQRGQAFMLLITGLLGLVLCLPACAVRHIQPVSQVESGQLRLGWTFDEFETAVPRVALTGMYGLEDGDVSAFAGGSALRVYAGGGYRYYLTTKATLAVRGLYRRHFFDLTNADLADRSERLFPFFGLPSLTSLSTRLTLGPGESGRVYGGLDVVTVLGAPSTLFSIRPFGGLLGVIFGIRLPIEQVDLQIESTVSPVIYQRDSGWLLYGTNGWESLIQGGQLGLTVGF